MKYKTALLLAFLFALTGGIALGQALPHKNTGSLILTDTSNDQVYRLTDFNLDGDYNDPGEIVLFFDYVSGNPIKATSDALGYVYVSDTTADTVLRFRDLDKDGTATGTGESTIYVDSGNLSGVTFSSIQGMSFDSNGDLYLSNSGSSGVNDMICRARDLNADGDCLDAGEIEVLYDSVEAANQGVQIILGVPMPCALSPDGWLMVSDVNDPNGDDVIVRMKDLNGDGDMYDAGEVEYYYNDTMGTYDFRNVDSLAFTHDGKLVMNESLDDIIYIGEDLNADGDIMDMGEVTIYRDGSSAGTRPDSSKGTAVAGLNDLYWDIYIAEYTDPNGAHGMRDKNGDGDADDTDELLQVYDDTVGDIVLATPKGVTFMKGPYLGYTGTPTPGGSFDLVMEGTVDNHYRLAWSLYQGNFFVPPYGILKLGWPPHILTTGTISPDGTDTYTVNVPTSAYPGLKIRFQALEGDAYYAQFSNLLEVVVQ